MFSAVYSLFSSTFVVEYFKDMVLGLLVVIYFAVLILTRPHVVKDQQATARGRRAAEAAEAAKALAR